MEEAIKSLNVSDAILMYRSLMAKNETIPDELKQSLLELVCFYNHKDPLPFDMFEERGLKDAVKRLRDAKVEEWTENSFADQLFESIEPKTAAAYNAMINALYKYNNRNRAETLFNEAKEHGIPFDLTTYNAYIGNANKPGMTAENRWDVVKATLTELSEKQIKPNVHTLNAILSTLKNGGNINSIREYASQTMAEFAVLNIEPSLETYSHLLDIFHGKVGNASNAIYDIVGRLEKNPDLIAQGVRDTNFFSKSMVVCRFRLENASAIARRIDNILTHSNNIKFIGDAELDQLYHRCFLGTILQGETLANFIRTYEQLVPESYSLEPSVAQDIFSKINLSGDIQYIPKFWSDMVISGISKRGKTNDILLTLMVSNQPVDGIREHIGLVDLFADIAWSIYLHAVGDHFARSQHDELLPALRLAQIIIILLRANRHGDAASIIEGCTQSDWNQRVLGALTEESLSAFIDSCIANKDPRHAIQCVAYSVEHGVGDAIQFGRKVIQSFTLKSVDIKRITNLVGQDALKSVQEPAK